MKRTAVVHKGWLVNCTAVERIWRGVYSSGPADDARKLRGLDLSCGEVVAICLGTAASAHGFDTEDTGELRHGIRESTL